MKRTTHVALVVTLLLAFLALLVVDRVGPGDRVEAPAGADAITTAPARGPLVGTSVMVDLDEQFAVDQLAGFYADVQRRIDEYLAWQHDQDLAVEAYLWAVAHPPAPPPRPAPVVAQAAPVSGSSSGDCGSVPAAAREIYMHESGCNPSAVNGAGCRGIGQACPGSKLPCGADFACQHAWFTAYAYAVYGSWENAWAAWQRKGWW